MALRPGDAGSNTALDDIAVTRDVLAQLPGRRSGRRPGKAVLVRTDGAGSSHVFLDWLTAQRVSYSVGFALPTNTGELLALMEESVWTPADSCDGGIREGAWVAELTGVLTLTVWPKGTRVIAGKERPHPGAQLRITDPDGMRVIAFATNSVCVQLPDLELATAAQRGRWTGSGARRRPGCATSRCTAWTRTAPGAPSSPSPPRSPPGRSSWP